MARKARISNPFYFGDLALDEAFTDREEELKSLTTDMLNGQNVALIAPRRYGKSSLVRRAAQALIAKGVLVAEVDLMKTPTKERLASHLARAIHDDLASPAFKAKETALGLFDSLRVKPLITYDPAQASYGFTFVARHSDEDIDATLERLLELPAQLAAEQNARVVLYLDEFQEVTAIDPTLPALMRAVFQEQPDVAHVYAGSKRDMMSRLFNDKNEAFYRSAKVLEIGVIPSHLFESFIRERFDATDKGVSDAAIEGVLDITQGHPYATQELAYALWDEVPAGFTATVSDLRRALDVVLRSENARFTLLWDNLSRAQRQLLQALALEPGHVQSARYLLQHGLPSASTMQKAARVLEGAELTGKRPDGATAIVEPFLVEWVERYAA
ncbi:MAG TPA: ATP-binding protein [Gaiellaceae bacterium]|nr:ATP-binding protein [Gaiellaceae bacterium]